MSEIVKAYLSEYPNTSSLSLAKKIYKEHKDKFTSLETVRSVIRYYRGANGKVDRKKLKDKTFASQKPINKYGIPDPDEMAYEHYHLPKACDNILVMNDIHVPFHSKESIELALEWGESKGINTILLNGDIIDFYQLSRFTKDPTKRSAVGEIQMLRQFLEGLVHAMPKVKIYYKYGNHEERYENFMKVKAPELFNMEEFRLDVIFHLRELGIESISGKRIIMAGKLPILHGHEFNGIGSSVNPARGLYLRTKQSAVIGHLHTSSEHNEPNLDGELSTTWSVGCLCDLHPEYAPINKWNHGFLHVRIAPDGNFKVHNARIYRGKIL